MEIGSFYSRVARMGPRGEQRACEALLFEGVSPERALRLGRKADENERCRHRYLPLDREIPTGDATVPLYDVIPDPHAEGDLHLVELIVAVHQEARRLAGFAPGTRSLIARAVLLIALGDATRVDEALRQAGGTPNRARRRGVRWLILRVGGGA